MLRVRNISNQYQKRTIRPLYAQTQATPYAAVLDPSLRNTDGSFRAPVAADSAPLARSAASALLQGGLIPGVVVAKGAGEGVVVHNGVAGVRAFGLLANFVGGTIDDLGDENNVGVWRGPDSVFEILAPAFNDTGLAAAYAAATPGNPVRLYAGTDGRLAASAPGGATEADVVALLIERSSVGKIVIDLKV
jgi:hypothetical protein